MAFVVHKVEPGTPAEQIGLRQGDLITEWNGKQIISIRDFLMMEQLEPGQPVEVTFFRADFAKGKYQTLKGAAPLAAFPSENGSK
jgi:S1-C subfamily serine protease